MAIKFKSLLSRPLNYVTLVNGKITPTDQAYKAIEVETRHIATRCCIHRQSSIESIERELRVAFWDKIRAEVKKHESKIGAKNETSC